MAIFGLNSLDALISLLLVETAWWTHRFFGVNLSKGLEFTVKYIDTRYLWSNGAFICIVLPIMFVSVSKFLIQGILWYAFLKNEADDLTRLPRIWYWAGVTLDLITLARIILSNIGYGPSFEWLFIQMITVVLPLLLVRGGIWIFGRRLILNLNIYGKSYFPSGFLAYVTEQCRTVTTISILLLWELIWYAVSSLGLILSVTLVYLEMDRGFVILPGPMEDVRGIGFPYLNVIITVPVGFLQLLAVTRGWKTFLKFWLPIYILNNIFGFVFLSLSELQYELERAHSLIFYIIFGVNALLPLCALILKIIIAIGSFKLVLSKPEVEAVPDKEKEDEEKPLILYRVIDK